jgi:hypothetical protein
MRCVLKITIAAAALVCTLALTLGACDSGSTPEPGPCAEATTAMQAVCCTTAAVAPPLPGEGLPEESVTYTDCLTGQPVTVPCTSTAEMSAKTETVTEADGGKELPKPEQACLDAVKKAQGACPDMPQTDPVQEIDCGAGAGQATALPSCEQVKAMADAFAGCAPAPVERWGHFAPDTLDPVFAALPVPPANVAPTTPPPPEEATRGTAPPTPFARLGGANPNALVDTLRLEIPGNFVRYQLATGPLHAAFAQAGGLQGFTCDADKLRCVLNPLDMIDLAAVIPSTESFSITPSRTLYPDGYVGWNLNSLTITADLGGYGTVTITWDGSVDLRLEKPVEINFGPPSRLSFLPLHQPDDDYPNSFDNSYSLAGMAPLDRQLNHLDRALLLGKLTHAQCDALSLAPIYLTWRLPMKCNCPPETGAETGYCVTELYPRADMPAVVMDHITASPAAHAVTCTDPMAVSAYSYAEELAGTPDPNLSNVRVDLPVDTWLNQGRHGTKPAAEVKDDLVRYGCSGRISKRLPMGTQTSLLYHDQLYDAGIKVSSAAGLELKTTVNTGGLRVAVNPGFVRLSIAIGVKVEEWLKKHKLGPLGWLLKWVLRVLEGIVNQAIQFELPPPGSVNEAWFTLEPIDLTVHGLLSQVQQAAGPGVKQGLALGVRRIVTSKPGLGSNDWGLGFNWGKAYCEEATGDATLVERFNAFFVCSAEWLSSIVGLAAEPLQAFLTKQLLDAVFNITGNVNELMLQTVVTNVESQEKGNIVATMLQDAVVNTFFYPYYAGTLGSETQARDGELPPGLATACAAAPNPALACTLAHLFVGNGLAEGELWLDLQRVGAKKHALSTGAVSGPAESFCLPEVRYCVVGDQPGGAADFTTADRSGSQDFVEVDANPPDSWDWRNQCALFLDLSPQVKGKLRTPTTYNEVAVWVSRRTEVLLNDIFVCRNSVACHPGQPALAARAELAFCSILADVWGRPGLAATPYSNEMVLLNSTTDPAALAVLEALWDTFRDAIGLKVPENAFSTLTSFSTTCATKLTEAGFPAPPASLPANTFDTRPPYACRATP